MLDRFADRFLIGRPLGYSFDQLMAEIEDKFPAGAPPAKAGSQR
jgi:hypothetical protein